MNPALLAGAGLIGLFVLGLALVRPRIALLILVVFDVSNLNGVIADNIGISPYKAELGLAAIALIALFVRRRSARIPWSPVLLGVGLLYAGFCLSLLNPADPVTSGTLLTSRLRDLVFFVVVYALVLTTDSIWHVAAGTVIVLAALAGLTVVHEFVLHNSGDLYGLSRVPLVQEGGAFTPRHAGTSSDVNFWARLLILFTPLAMSLCAAASRLIPRLFWAGCALSLIAGIYLTQSRGGFIAVFLALVAWLALAGGRLRKSLLAGPVIIAILVPISGIGSRLATLTAIASSSTSSADPSVVTRKRLQLDALRMFLDSPLTGHGIGSYPALFPQYDRLANNFSPVTIVVAAHNLYLEQAADGGIFLLMAWGLFIGSIYFVAIRTRVAATRAGAVLPARLSIAVLAGVGGWLVASVFLHLSDFRALLLLAAIAAAADVRARGLPPLPWERSTVRRSHAFRVAAGVLALVGAAALATGLITGQDRHRATATMAVVPSSDRVNGSTAYQLDVVSRGLIVPTMAGLLESSVSADNLARRTGRIFDGATVDVAPSRSGGAVVITITAARRADVEAMLPAAMTLATEDIAALRAGYEVAGTAGPETVVRPLQHWLVYPGLGLMLLGLAGVLLRRRARPAEPVEPVAEPAAEPEPALQS